jgi:diaminohydroxyphosphoribosylaminopyrimidine deaminase/5-amino-6-(5-phosphoribosylamino)uracil reductase
VKAGLVDEYLVYQAPMLLGGERMALGDIGVGTIGDARRLRIVAVDRLGEDLLVVARPIGAEPDGGVSIRPRAAYSTTGETRAAYSTTETTGGAEAARHRTNEGI